MADPISFDPYLGWVDVTDPNNIPEDARTIGASDMLRLENFGIDAAKAINDIRSGVGLDVDAAVAGNITDEESLTRAAVAGIVAGEVSGFQDVIDDIPARVDTKLQADVPPAVAAAIAADSTITAAATNAVNAKVTGLDLVTSADPRIPKNTATSSSELLAGFLDADRQETWLGARRTDGGPTDHAMRHLISRLGVGPLNAPGYLFALADANKNLTDLAIRSSDGQFADFVIERLKLRILEGFTPPTPVLYADTKWQEGAAVRPTRADSTRVAGFGSSSMAGIDSRLNTLFASKGAAYYSGGKGGEKAEHIAARIGSTPALINVTGGSIPASGPVVITTPSMITTSNLRAYTGTLAGIHGTLAYDAGTPGYRFTRTTAGAALAVPNGTPFLPDARSYRDAVMVLWMGKNNAGDANADTTVINLTNAAFDWLVPFAKRCLVLGHFVDTTTVAGHIERTQITAINAAHAARYGRLFIDISAYITSAQVWTDTGITPTSTDLTEQALGNKPPSLSADNGHFNAAGYDAVLNYLIIPRLAELGWYA